MVFSVTEPSVSERRHLNMSRIKSKNTTPEILVRSTLHKHGYRYRLHVTSLPGKPDIVLPRYMIAIFVHGCFWHMHGCKNSQIPKTRHEWWKAKLESNVKRDITQFDALRSLGWRVLVLWECQFRRLSRERLEKSKEKMLTIIDNMIHGQT